MRLMQAKSSNQKIDFYFKLRGFGLNGVWGFWVLWEWGAIHHHFH